MSRLVLSCRRMGAETWRQAVERIAGKYGLQAECLQAFDIEIAGGCDEQEAAWHALYEWDCLDLSAEPSPN